MAIRMSRWLGVLAVVGVGALLGACGPSKEVEGLTMENKDLRTKVDTIDQRLGAAESNVNALSAEVKARPAIYTPPTGPDEIGGGTGKPRPDRGTGRTVDLGTNLFASGSDQLTAASKKTIDSAVKGIGKGSTISVQGFADKTPPSGKGKFKTNEALSQARAESVRKYLASKGYNASDAVGMGAVSHNGKAPSRRVELVVN